MQNSISNITVRNKGASPLTWNSSLEPSGIPEGCLIMTTSVQAIWNNKDDVISVEALILTNNIKAIIVTPIVFIVGCPTNLLSMLVFAKHGLNHRINACLFTLSLTDLLYVAVCFCMHVEQVWSISIQSPQYIGHVTQLLINNRVMGLYGLHWASLFISAVIAVERCLCVVLPLRVKTLINAKVIWAILSVGVVLSTVGYFWVGEKYSVKCAYDEEQQTSTLVVFASEYYLRNRHFVDTLDVTVYGLALPLVTVATVTIATSVTVIQLHKSVAWRHGSSSSSLSALSAKEIALTNMLVYLSVQFIILNLPSVVVRITCLFVPEVSNYGRHYNLYYFLMAIVYMLSILKTSLNFFIYFLTGARYRKTVVGLFRVSIKRKNTIFSVVLTQKTNAIYQ